MLGNVTKCHGTVCFFIFYTCSVATRHFQRFPVLSFGSLRHCRKRVRNTHSSIPPICGQSFRMEAVFHSDSQNGHSLAVCRLVQFHFRKSHRVEWKTKWCVVWLSTSTGRCDWWHCVWNAGVSFGFSGVLSVLFDDQENSGHADQGKEHIVFVQYVLWWCRGEFNQRLHASFQAWVGNRVIILFMFVASTILLIVVMVKDEFHGEGSINLWEDGLVNV